MPHIGVLPHKGRDADDRIAADHPELPARPDEAAVIYLLHVSTDIAWNRASMNQTKQLIAG
jgi:hypothetical protein